MRQGDSCRGQLSLRRACIQAVGMSFLYTLSRALYKLFLAGSVAAKAM